MLINSNVASSVLTAAIGAARGQLWRLAICVVLPERPCAASWSVVRMSFMWS